MLFQSVVRSISSRFLLLGLLLLAIHEQLVTADRISLNAGWKFSRWTTNPDNLAYDKRSDITGNPTLLKSWILPSGNNFISSSASRHQRPSGNPSGTITYVQTTFDDSSWQNVTLPHDWAIQGPFYTGSNAPVGAGMGRLPVQGVGWYRRKISISASDAAKSVYLDVDGAMSYAMVWLNGNLVGGWPYGYASFRLELTPYLVTGDNQLAIRLDNPTDSSRWYPGGGIYRNVWLTTVDRTHVAQWGTFITTPTVSSQAATVNLAVQVENNYNASRQITVATDIHLYDPTTGQAGDKVTSFSNTTVTLSTGAAQSVNSSVTVTSPRLWGPPPSQTPNLYVAVTSIYASDSQTPIDTYQTRFGIRAITYDATKGLLVNGIHVPINGVNLHHDQGALGAAFNVRSAQRRLEILQDMGANAIRMSHNPPAPELLDLTDQMGFVVLDEIFDCWSSSKTTNDFHYIFADWHEPDLRAFIRRDRNHPSIYAWSFGNEVAEQSGSSSTTSELHGIVAQEDPTRRSTASMNLASAGSAFANVMDIESLNYQGEGLFGSSGSFDSFHSSYPSKMIESSESAATVSSRGTYIFPVTSAMTATAADGTGGNSTSGQVSAYELYTASFGLSPDKVFAAHDAHTYVAGEFVWSGIDYLGETTPYDASRSSYFGIIDLAGFKKDRFYIYQAHWRPDYAMAHILPHWNWPSRVGQVTPVHVFSSGDEAELFVNGKSQGRIKKASGTYRFRWDSVTYQSGTVQVVTYLGGQPWANATVQTTGVATQLKLTADRASITADGVDLSFITAQVLDANGLVVPTATNAITFSVSGPGAIVATDNGDQTDMTVFPSKTRKAFGGLALAIVSGQAGAAGSITVTASSAGLTNGQVVIQTQ